MSFSRRLSVGRLRLVALAATLIVVMADGALAQGTYLKVDGINGEVKEVKHVDWIDVQSFSVGVTQAGARAAGAGSAAAAGRASLSDLSVTKFVDASSPALFLHACNGKHIKSVVLEVTGSGGKGGTVYLRYTFTDVLVTGVQTSGTGADARPQEQVTFAYAKIQVEYIPVDPKGGAGKPIQSGWDVGTNKQASAPTPPEGSTTPDPSQAAASGEPPSGEQAAAMPAPATARIPVERRAIERMRVRQP